MLQCFVFSYASLSLNRAWSETS